MSYLIRPVFGIVLLGVFLAGLVGTRVPALPGAGVVWAKTSEGA